MGDATVHDTTGDPAPAAPPPLSPQRPSFREHAGTKFRWTGGAATLPPGMAALEVEVLLWGAYLARPAPAAVQDAAA